MPGSRRSDLPRLDSPRSPESYLKAAEYFEGRAKRARASEERLRFLSLVEKYRRLAGCGETVAEVPPPPGPAGRPAPAAKGKARKPPPTGRRG